MKNVLLTLALVGTLLGAGIAVAQDVLPYDNGPFTYHASPKYRETESHPLRILAYALHPVGWLAREVVFRPFSYIASSTTATRSIFGYRAPYDYRQPECFSADDAAPDCRTVLPFNYNNLHSSNLRDGKEVVGKEMATDESARQIYFPDVNFDFNKHGLTDLGEGKVHQIADLLKQDGNLKIVLEGHADFVGNDSYNEKLGMDRSDAVRSELLRLGVSSDRLSTVTFGKSQPIYEDKEDWARAVNRRVAVKVDSGAKDAAKPAASAEVKKGPAKSENRGEWKEVS